MTRWTFGRTIAAGFAIVVVLDLIAGAIALLGLHGVVSSKDRVIAVDTQLQLTAQQLQLARSERSAALRAYLITGDQQYATQAQAQNSIFASLLTSAQGQVHTSQGRDLLSKVAQTIGQTNQSLQNFIALKSGGASASTVAKAFENAAPLRVNVQQTLNDFSAYEQQLAAKGAADSKATADRDGTLIISSVIVSLLATILVGLIIVKRLRERIGSAVGQVASSSVELQTTANQQANGAIEQATAMSQISMTITELLASSQQIAESAQRVADVADQTANEGRSGQDRVTSARVSMAEIRQQVDAIVDHMVELGDTSQRIGVVLDIVSELSEQTNILAINSTIEAAGAGESGRRFGVVADEIRKLADRVAESTKEVRSLIDQVRSAVQTTIMATEIGSKAVDSGASQFTTVADAFERIVAMVTSASEAAREIELSTKQQTTAVEQVNIAVSNATETTKENESGTTQTLQTASQLAELSTRLRQLVDAAPEN